MHVFKRALFAFITFLIFLMVLELVSRLIEQSIESSRTEEIASPGWQAKFFGGIFDWHEPDPDLLWKFKPNLNNPLIKTNSHSLIGDEVSFKKNPNAFRILLLGDSSPVGLGLESYKQTFGELLRFQLELLVPDTVEVELINASVSGYSSEQLRWYLKNSGWKYKPDVILLYCGNNDASVSGKNSDQQLLESQRFKLLRRLLHKSALYRVLTSVLVPRETADNGELVLRVSPDRFSENLKAIVGECQRRNRPIFLLKPPVPYYWPPCLQFKPFAHLSDEAGEVILPESMRQVFGASLKFCISAEMFERLYGPGDKFARAVYNSAFEDSLSPKEAIDHYYNLAKSKPDDPFTQNNLGVSLWETGNYEKAETVLLTARRKFVKKFGDSLSLVSESAGSPIMFNIGINLLSWGKDEPMAQAYLDSALQSDYFSLRIKSDYWDVMDRFKEWTGVNVIDLMKLFQDNCAETLFIDHCHPTARGHALIAEEIVRQLMDNRFLPTQE